MNKPIITIEDIEKIVGKYGYEDWRWDFEDVVNGMFADINLAIKNNAEKCKHCGEVHPTFVDKNKESP